MSFGELLDPVLARRDLDPGQAEALMAYLVSGEASDAQIGGALLALRTKGCHTRELAAFARVLRERMLAVDHAFGDLVDTCGTGGGAPSFNLSTASAIVAAAAGARVAKHGNRAVTSKCGMADVLEALGVPMGGAPDVLADRLERDRIAFLFAPDHHPAMRHVGPARRSLGVRTVFNQLGPLANPAGARRQLIGVYDPGMMRSMGEALRELGAERALIVHGKDGLDEVSPCAPTDFVRVEDGRVWGGTVSPADFGLAPLDPAALAPGQNAASSAVILREAVSDADSPRAAALLPNVAAALVLAGVAEDFPEGAARARAAIASGAAAAKLEALRS